MMILKQYINSSIDVEDFLDYLNDIIYPASNNQFNYEMVWCS